MDYGAGGGRGGCGGSNLATGIGQLVFSIIAPLHDRRLGGEGAGDNFGGCRFKEVGHSQQGLAD
jgi:hypothetical protein